MFALPLLIFDAPMFRRDAALYYAAVYFSFADVYVMLRATIDTMLLFALPRCAKHDAMPRHIAARYADAA